MGAEVCALLFSDIEGSTRLLQRLGPEYVSVLARHRRIIRSAVVANAGEERGTEGDSFFVTFPTVAAAVLAAVDAQRALGVEPWPAEGVVRVRMGIHVGEIAHTEAGIVGLAVHHAARIAAAAHGAQVVVSGAARAVAGDVPGVRWVALGDHVLRDVGTIELFRLDAPGLRGDFAPLRAERTLHVNLPVPSSSLVGRGPETEQVLRLLQTHRLVTLTGTGGCGKTRLALAVAANVRGVEVACFVELADVRDPSDVPRAIGDRLGSDASIDSLTRLLQRQPTLLVIDNCEHLLVEVAEVVDRLLARTTTTRLLTTSREPLGLTGEVVHRVPSLAVPHQDAPLSEMLAADAVRLFDERARQVRADYHVTTEDAAAVRSICARLDGIPLAIELAAARMSALSAAEIDARLTDRFRLLTGRTRTAIGRQQTLLAAVTWSYRLLARLEQDVLARLSVLRPGFSLDDAVAVAGTGEDPYDVVNAVTALHDKSLLDTVGAAHGRTRFRLPETILQFAADRLADRDEEEATRDRHAVHFNAVADRLLLGPRHESEASWADEWRACKPNVRAAVEWLTTRDPLMAVAVLCDWIQMDEIVEPVAGMDDQEGLLGAVARDPRLADAAEGAWAAAHTHDMRGDQRHALEWARVAEERLTDATMPVLRAHVPMMRDDFEMRLGDCLYRVDRRRELCVLADACPGPVTGILTRVAASHWDALPDSDAYSNEAVAMAVDQGIHDVALWVESDRLRLRVTAWLQPDEVRRVREIAAALAGSAHGPLSGLDVLLAEYGDTAGALSLSSANLRWLRNRPAQSAGLRRYVALGIAAHVHLLAGVRDTAVDLAGTVLAVHPPEEWFVGTGLVFAVTTQSAVHRIDHRPDLAARLLARVPIDQFTHLFRGSTRLLDEAALAAADIGQTDAAERLAVTANQEAHRAGRVRSPWQDQQIASLARSLDPDTPPLTTDEMRRTIAALAAR